MQWTVWWLRVLPLLMFHCFAHICGALIPSEPNRREKLGVDGNIVEDIVITWCCPCCAISQEMRALGITEPIITKPGECFGQLKPGAAPLS